MITSFNDFEDEVNDDTEELRLTCGRTSMTTEQNTKKSWIEASFTIVKRDSDLCIKST
jgi:hypothetical protein